MINETALAPLNDELAKHREALQKSTEAIDLVGTFTKSLKQAGLQAHIEMVGRTAIRIDLDLNLPWIEGGAREAAAATAVVPPAAEQPPRSRRRKQSPWTDEEVETVLRRHRAGATAPAIANEVGRSVSSVKSRILRLRKEHDIRPRRPARRASLRIGTDLKDADREVAAVKEAVPAIPAPTSLEPETDNIPDFLKRPAAPLDGLTGAQREISARLDRLPFSSWSAEDDLDLVEAVVRGEKIPAVAAELELPRDDCLARWRGLCPNPSPQTQADLLVVLRARTKAARGRG